MMNFVLTLVASRGILSALHIGAVTSMLEKFGVAYGEPDWLHIHKAADIGLNQKPDREAILKMRDALSADHIDMIFSHAQNRKCKALFADMDSTIVDGETLDKMAIYMNRQEEIPAITEAAMKGELDFADALRARTVMLVGMDQQDMDKVLQDTNLMKGAELLVRTMRKNGAHCVLVSSGYTYFTESIAARAGFHEHHGNVLEIVDGKLNGFVSEPILDKDMKLTIMQNTCDRLNIDLADVLALGDGANDIAMLLGAGLGVGYHPKQIVKECVDNIILHGDLSVALYAQGYRERDIYQ